MFGKVRSTGSSTPVIPPRPHKEEPDNPIVHGLIKEQDTEQQNNNDVTGEHVPKIKSSGVMGVMKKVNPFKSSLQTSSTVKKAPSQESIERGAAADHTQNPGMLKGVMQKVNPFKSTTQATSTVTKAPSTGSLGQESTPDTSQNPGLFKGVVQKMNPFHSTPQATSTPVTKSPSSESLERRSTPESTQNPGMIVGMMQKVNPFKSSSKKQSQHGELSSSADSLTDNNNLTEKQATKSETLMDTVDHHATKQNQGKFKGMMQKVNPFKSSSQIPNDRGTDSSDASKMTPVTMQDTGSLHSSDTSSSDSQDDATIERRSIWYTDGDDNWEGVSQPREAPKKKTVTFRIKRILPGSLFASAAKNSSTGSTDVPLLAQEEVVEVQTLQLAEAPSSPGEESALEPLDDEDGLMSWWRTVEGWDDWNESAQESESEDVCVEEAADRVFMAARLFVRLFNRHGASLQQRILELLSLADAADTFHKKTVVASMGGGVASVAGSITTITGLVLAPFTMGTSLIVTAVGIGVATAGGVASASANITDTVHSKTDRKKVEQMVKDYQEEIRDISECLQFLQEGMEALESWDFEAYAQTISRNHLNQNVKHVMKEGGRAGKALLINTESLISTVQVLGVAGGAAKAVQVMSVTTGVMSGLFLALDVFFLAKDSLELKKGAKTEFATKIREVCKELQDGLLELNNIKEELQKTMDGIEVEVEVEEEEEEEEDEEEQLKSCLKKLKELEG